MKVETRKIDTGFRDAFDKCYVHARGLLTENGFGLITMQKLLLSGCDVFDGLEMMTTTDGGESFSAIRPCKRLRRRHAPDGTSETMSDATPFYHKKTGKILLVGHTVAYGADNALLGAPRPISPAYAVYNEKTGDFDAYRKIEMPATAERLYFAASAGSSQICELPSGDLLLPFRYRSYEESLHPWETCTTAAVMRCTFDGETVTFAEIGNGITVDVPRGLGEPSLVKFGDEYFVALRNDESGFVTKSRDGLSLDAPRPLCFDDGKNAGNYCTQQHWLVGGGKLWLVYTRIDRNNGHVFRHRAPLFMAEFDPEGMCLIRDTEVIVVPERGARLGNFGCQSYSDSVGYVFASEWMQGPNGVEGCMAHGSDNSVWIAKIRFE